MEVSEHIIQNMHISLQVYELWTIFSAKLSASDITKTYMHRPAKLLALSGWRPHCQHCYLLKVNYNQPTMISRNTWIVLNFAHIII